MIAEIDKKLLQLTDKQLKDVVDYLEMLNKKQSLKYNIVDEVDQVMKDDENLLNRLAQ